MKNDHKKLASLSLDLDNLWTYMKTHGDSGWEKYPSYLDIVVPRVLDTLDELGLKITFFIVGKDAEREENRSALRSIVERGHEVGNHSLNHEPWISSYDKDIVRREISLAEDYIVAATGQKPIGFRGPGFSWSLAHLTVLADRGYLFDASTLPTYTGPLARAYYFHKANLSVEEKDMRKELYGNFRDGFRSVKPYCWILPGGKSILEIPVTTIPVFKLPFHLSYLLYLSRYSEVLSDIYLKIALYMCELTGTKPSFLLHPVDFIGGDELKEISFFPGMDMSSGHKIRVFKKIMTLLSRYYTFVSMGRHAGEILSNGSITQVELIADSKL
jgi:peptidoglycan-N-acetylglucosamine deacetylase